MGPDVSEQNWEQYALLKRGVEDWNDWRAANPNVQISLYGFNFDKRNLSSVNLAGADLRGSGFSDALIHVGGISVTRDEFIEVASFRGSVLDSAVFAYASIRGADFHNASLRETNFFAASLADCFLDGADFSNATFGLPLSPRLTCEKS